MHSTRALWGVIVPLINNAEEATAAVAAAKYPPFGIRSYGPMRSQLRIGPVPADANRATVVFAMIETPTGSGERRRDLRSARIGRRVRGAVRPTNRRRR